LCCRGNNIFVRSAVVIGRFLSDASDVRSSHPIRLPSSSVLMRKGKLGGTERKVRVFGL